MKNSLSTSLILLSIFSTPAFADYPELIKSNPKIKPMEKTNPNPINVAYSPTDPNWKKIVINKDIAEITEDEKDTADISQPAQQNETSSEPSAETTETAESTEQTTAPSNDTEKEEATFSDNKEVEKATATEKESTKENSTYEKDTSKKSSGFSIHGFQLGAGLGILNGASAHIGYRIPYNSDNFFKNRFGFRLEYNSWSPLEKDIKRELEKHPIDIDGNDFNIAIKGKNFGALIDFYPFSYTPILGNIRISTGYYKGDFSLTGSMTQGTNEIFSISDSHTERDLYYKVNGIATLNANFNYDIKGPYAGLGFDFGLLFGLKLYFDAGVVFTDKPEITTDIKGEGTLKICGNDDTCATGQNVAIDTSNAQIQKLLSDTKALYEDELDALRKGYYPIIKLGILLRF